MTKLLLTSNGFDTPEIVQACVKLAGKPKDEISFAIINEGYAVETGDKRWVLNDFRKLTDNFSGEVDLVNLLALDTETIKRRCESKDVVYVIGGNTDYLMHVFRKSGFADILPKLLQTKVYVGISAGSMVAGRRISTEAYEKIYGEEEGYNVRKYMNLVDFGLKPHLDSTEFPNNRREILEDVCRDMDFSVYALKDATALLVRDGVVAAVGDEPLRIKPKN